MRVLILRSEPGARATAFQVSQRGFEPVVVPLFDVVAVAWTPPTGTFDAVAMTSANAARHGGVGLRALRHLPLYAVGEATVAAARAAGFADITVGTGDADDLARAIPRGVQLVHLCGTERRPLPIPGVTEIAIYTTVPRAVDLAAITNTHVALVHAASAGARLAELVPPSRRAPLRLIAISARAAAACGAGWHTLDVARRPREDAMLELLGELCEKRA